jgi:hypothetical protein
MACLNLPVINVNRYFKKEFIFTTGEGILLAAITVMQVKARLYNGEIKKIPVPVGTGIFLKN